MKKALAIIMSVLLVASLFAACGGKDDATTTTTASGEGTTGGTLKIGASGPLTGGAAVYGVAVKRGAEIAIEEINAAGGINGMQIEFNFQDDEHDAEKAVNAYNSLKDWGMQLMMGTVTTGPCLAIIDQSNADNMFQLTPSASSTDCIVNGNVFQVCFTDPNQGTASADYISDNNVATKVAVIYNSSDAYSSGIYETFKAEAAKKGLEIVSETSFTDDSKSDFSVQVGAAKNAGAELVFLPIYAQEASLILAQANSAEYKPIFFGCDGLDGILTIEGFDAKLAEGTMLLTPFAADAKDAKTQKFVTTFNAKYNETPNQFAADAYDAIYILKAACEAKNITSDMTASQICDLLKAAMTGISVDGLTGAAMTWNATGAVSKAPKAVVIKNGAYVAA